MWDQENWKRSLHTKWAGRNLSVHSELVSTNLTAARLSREGWPHGTLVTADKQTGGRGRRGRTWESPAGKNLYFSLLLKPDLAVEKASMLTLVMAHAAALAIESFLQEPVDIKWPNDLLLHGRKICGILTELQLEGSRIGHVIVGVGINVRSQQFEGELAAKASSLEEETGIDISRELLLQRIMEFFEKDFELFEQAGDLSPLLEEYEKRLLNKNHYVKVLDPKDTFEGIARGITSAGELLVERADGTRQQVYAGEVSVRGKRGYV